MEPRIDEMVLRVQEWLNTTYESYVASGRYKKVPEDGKTGWPTIRGLIRALQIELKIPETSDTFGPKTYELCPTVTQGTEGNIVYIIQGGLWCKGYSPGGFNGYYGPGTYAAVKSLKSDAGFPSASGNMQRDFMRALLDMSAFTVIGFPTAQKERIREVQQSLNYDYYDYYKICPCDGLYNREMNKMLIYALQKELGISQNLATGAWGPTTINNCKQKVFSIGNSSPIVKLIRYACVCNGFPVSISSSTYDSTLDGVLQEFCSSLLITKPSDKANYAVIKSLLSSNGDIDRPALGCDTATRLSPAQIQTIKNAGYKYVGRYIANVVGGTLDKALTRTEIENIINAGLKIIYLFQQDGRNPKTFTRTLGEKHAIMAINAMNGLGAPREAVIYFAVDCDPIDSEISQNIIPYFNGIIDAFVDKNVDFKIGIYGTRNVCKSVKESTYTALESYVCDASYGFSGNLGFTMPSNWAFDQFNTDTSVGSGVGYVEIDKVAVSGQDNATYGALREPETPIPEDCTVYTPDSAQKFLPGRLYVNMGNALHVYDNIRTFDEKDGFVGEKQAVPRDVDLMYTIPKYGMYVNIGIVREERDGTLQPSYFTHLIKFLDEKNERIRYGYIMVRNQLYYEGPLNAPLSSQLLNDVYEYGNQREFTNYVVDKEQNTLVASVRDQSNCVHYTLSRDTTYYKPTGESMGVLPANTIVAVASSNTGETHNEYIEVISKYNALTEQWEPFLPFNQSAFIDYQLENGSMPNNRLLL